MCFAIAILKVLEVSWLRQARAFRYIFFQKDAAAIATSPKPATRFGVPAPASLLTTFAGRSTSPCPPSSSRTVRIGQYAALNLANSSRPSGRQAIAFFSMWVD
jgi:hypothetical protein